MINRCMHIERTEFALSFKANCGRLYVLGTGLLSVGLPAVLLLRAETQENRASEIAGAVILSIGTPLMMTLSDRLFRSLR